MWALFRVAKVEGGSAQQQSGACRFCGTAGGGTLEDGMIVCRTCDSVLDRFLDHAAEWRFFGAEDARAGGNDVTRCGPPVNELIPTLGSVVHGNRSWRPRDAPAHAGCASGVASSIVPRYQMWNALTYRQRTLCGVFELMAVSANQYGLPTCILEEAKCMYKRLTEGRITRGPHRGALVACSVYMSCKSNRVPRSIKEVAAMFDVPMTAMTRSCRVFEQVIARDLGTSTCADFVGRFCSRLELDEDVARAVKAGVQCVEAEGMICDSTPPTIVSGVLHLVNLEAGLGITRAALVAACHTSWATIHKCYKRLLPHKATLETECIRLVRDSQSRRDKQQQLRSVGE
jgi:transcription initiation factor TFIIIB Brf1 subunit/transcription initiation factor TFIIB